ncbi:uncharacterized protein LOC144549918 [Carex rostrata]
MDSIRITTLIFALHRFFTKPSPSRPFLHKKNLIGVPEGAVLLFRWKFSLANLLSSPATAKPKIGTTKRSLAIFLSSRKFNSLCGLHGCFLDPPATPPPANHLGGTTTSTLISPSANHLGLRTGSTAVLLRYATAHVEGFLSPSQLERFFITQFGHGQSNPTYFLEAVSNGTSPVVKRYVLRKKPSGVILQSAYAVEREYQVLKALGDHTDVPVPKVFCLCHDSSIIGTPFYIMEYLEGRIYADNILAGVEPEKRRVIYLGAARALAVLHQVDVDSIGLQKYGRREFLQETTPILAPPISRQSVVMIIQTIGKVNSSLIFPKSSMRIINSNCTQIRVVLAKTHLLTRGTVLSNSWKENEVRAQFEFINKLGVNKWCFHDRDIALDANTLSVKQMRTWIK